MRPVIFARSSTHRGLSENRPTPVGEQDRHTSEKRWCTAGNRYPPRACTGLANNAGSSKPAPSRQVEAHAHEHPAPTLVMNVKVILHHPALRDLQMPSIVLLIPDSHHDAGWFPPLNDGHDLVRF